jgi:hypothetical protein
LSYSTLVTRGREGRGHLSFSRRCFASYLTFLATAYTSY